MTCNCNLHGNWKPNLAKNNAIELNDMYSNQEYQKTYLPTKTYHYSVLTLNIQCLYSETMKRFVIN